MTLMTEARDSVPGAGRGLRPHRRASSLECDLQWSLPRSSLRLAEVLLAGVVRADAA